VVDPLDGTVNYLYGIPQWGVSVALEDGSGARVAVVLDPLRRETFTAVRGSGALLNGGQVRVSGCDSLDRALVATGFGYEAERRAQQASVVARALPQVRDIRRAGSAALDICWLACGRLDGYYERGVQHWDWAAARLIAEEAGAAVEELRGDPPGLVAAAPELMGALRELVS
jgi:myo-inositol-1(or 4)-monophosphatase